MTLTEARERHLASRRRYDRVRFYAERWRRIRPTVAGPDDDPHVPDEYVDEVCLWLWDHPQPQSRRETHG